MPSQVKDHFVKKAPSDIGVVRRKPYLRSFSIIRGFLQAFWGTERVLMSRSDAYEAAYRWGPNWKAAVRVMRVKRCR